MQEAAWSAWADGGAQAVRALYRARQIEVEEKTVKQHYWRHRPRQGPPRRLPGREAMRLWQRMPDRRRQVVSLLCRAPGMSARQVADLCYLGQKPQTAMPAALRDLRILQKQGFLFQVFLEHLPGGGPRPAGAPGLYFPGVQARISMQLEKGSPGKRRHDWWDRTGDWKSWTEAWDHWQRAEIRNLIFGQLPILGSGFRGRPGLRVDWAGIYDRRRASFLFQDPLLGRTRFQADGLIGMSTNEGTVPVFIQMDRLSLPVDEVVRRAAALAALHRSGQLDERFDLPAGARALLLVISDSAERVPLLRRRAGHLTVAGDSPVLVSDRHTAQLGLDQDLWQPLFSDSEPISLIYGLRGLSHWPQLDPGQSLREKRNPDLFADPAIPSSR